MTKQKFPHMSEKARSKDRPIQDSVVNESSTFSKESGEQFIVLLKARRAVQTVTKLFEKDIGTGKNTHDRGLALQNHKADVKNSLTSLKVVGGTEYE